jgi:hypothetical protein
MSMYKANISTNGASTSVSIAPPPLSIMAFLGTIDPDGWVICDGKPRTNGSDGRYNNLIAAHIGSVTANAANYTPPDYRGAFLRGAGTNPSKSGYAGSNVGVVQNHATQTHTHTINDPGHYHTYTDSYGDQTQVYRMGYGGQRDSLSSGTGKAYTDITINNSITNVDNNETRPYNYSVNWIIKL